jgi:hypothetical protein
VVVGALLALGTKIAGKEEEPVSDYTTTFNVVKLESGQEPQAPVVVRRRRRRPRVRRVTRVIRHIDTWTVFKVVLLD